jgi:molybdenum cofactor guanylyltransferase
VQDNRILAAILCGGASQRMGRDKARLAHPTGGSLLQRAVILTSGCCTETVLLSGSGQRYPEPGMVELADAVTDCGPLGGLVAALRHAGERSVLLLPVDMAGLESSHLKALIAEYWDGGEGVVVAQGAGRRHPTLSIWAPGCLPLAESSLADNLLAMNPLLDRLEARELDLPGAALVNWNRPEDLER